MSDFYFNPDGSDELYHYGVLGMKWGQRKSPNSYGGSITKKSNSKSITTLKNTSKQSKEHQDKVAKAKKAVAIGTAVTATALAAYGAYKFVKNKNVAIAAQKGENYVKKYISENKMNLDIVKLKGGEYGAHAYSKSGNRIGYNTMNKKQLEDTARSLANYNKRVMSTANSRKNSMINNAKKAKFKTAAKNVYKYYRG